MYLVHVYIVHRTYTKGRENRMQSNESLATPGVKTVVEAHGLVKRYGEMVALDGLDLSIPEGTVLGVLGPNGAGRRPPCRS